MTGDVQVLGLVMGGHHLEDIGITVPQGQAVTIPADKAVVSRDLHRAISQRLVFPLHPGPGALPVVFAKDDGERQRQVEILTQEVSRLREENLRLKQEVAQLKQEVFLPKDTSDPRLDEILNLVKSITSLPNTVLKGAPVPVEVPRVTLPGVVEVETPQFIPSQIRPDGVETHIEPTREVSDGAGVGGAVSALRKLRQR